MHQELTLVTSSSATQSSGGGCHARPQLRNYRVFVNEDSQGKEVERVGEGPRSTLSAELLSRWGEGLRSLGVEGRACSVSPFPCCWPSRAVTGQGPWAAAVPVGSVPFSPKDRDQAL